MAVSDTLLKALDILHTQGWCQRQYAAPVFDEDGSVVDDADTGPVCAVGALNKAEGRKAWVDRPYNEARKALEAGLPVSRGNWTVGGRVSAFNDAPNTTFEDVEALYSRAIAIAVVKEAEQA